MLQIDWLKWKLNFHFRPGGYALRVTMDNPDTPMTGGMGAPGSPRRAACVEAYARGHTYRAIAEQLHMSIGSVQAAVRSAKASGTLSSVPRTRGRPRGIDAQVARWLAQAMQTTQSTNARQLQEHLAAHHGVQLSYEVVRRRVKELSLQQQQSPEDEIPSGDTADLAMLADTVREIITQEPLVSLTAPPPAAEPQRNGLMSHQATIENQPTAMLLSADATVDCSTLPASSRTGRPRATNEDMELLIRRLLQRHPTITARALQHEILRSEQVELSFETIRRRIREFRQDDPSAEDATCSAFDQQIQTQDECFQASTVESSPAEDSPLLTQRRRKKHQEYSTALRERCVRKHEVEGQTYLAIAKELAIPPDTVRAIVRKAKRTGSVATAPRSGRPRKTNELVDNVILQAVKTNQRCTARMIQEDLWTVFNVQVSCETVRRRVKAHAKHRHALTGAALANTAAGATGTAVANALPPAPSQQPTVDMLMNTDPASSLQQATSVFRPITTQRSQADGVHDHIGMDFDNNSLSQPHRPSVVLALDPAPLCDQGDHPSQPPEATTSSRKRNEYSVSVRERCVALHSEGHGYRRIGQELGMPHTTVRAIVEKMQRTGTVLPAPRSGRPRKTDDIVDKVILQAVKSSEQCSARMIQEVLRSGYDVHVSCETIRRRVRDHSRQQWQQPTSTEVQATASTAEDVIHTQAAPSVETVPQALESSLLLEQTAFAPFLREFVAL